jgi:hypothetical protein
MDDHGCVLDHSFALGDSVLLCAVHQTTDVYGVDGCDVPNRLGYLARFAGARIFRMGDTRGLAHATVWTRSDATPIDSAEDIALGKAKADQEC